MNPSRSQPTAHAVLVHTERASGATLFGPLVGIGIALAVGGFIAFASGSSLAWTVTLGIPLALLAALVLARAGVTVSDDGVELRGPFIKRFFAHSEISEVAVAPDDGLAEGHISWFVTREDGGARTRINMGGAASVTVTHVQGRRTQLVVRDLSTAETIASAITAMR